MRGRSAIRLWRALGKRELMADYTITRSEKNAYGEPAGEVPVCQVQGYFSALAHRVNPYNGENAGVTGIVCQEKSPMLYIPHGAAEAAMQGDKTVVNGRQYRINTIDTVQGVYDVVSLTLVEEQYVEEGI